MRPHETLVRIDGRAVPMTRNPLDTQPTHEDGDVDVEANTQDLNTEVEKKSGTSRSDRAQAKKA